MPLLLFLAGCHAFNDHRAALRDLQAQGRYDLAAATLDSPQTQKLYGDNDRLLLWLDRGSAALALHDDERTIVELEKAEDFMESRHGPSGTDIVGQWLLNDTTTEYIGEPYESIYVNDLKLLAQLERGIIQGGATVEARRAAGKADHLRDLYLKYREAVYKKGGADFAGQVKHTESQLSDGSSGGAGAGPLIAETKDGQFIESTLGTYLTAVTFMAAGDRDNQGVAGRRLLDSIRLQRGTIGLVQEDRFRDIGERSPTDHDLLIVALSGLGPTKHAQRFGPIPIYQWPVYFEFPILDGGSAQVASARVLIAPVPAGAVPDPAAAGSLTGPEPTPATIQELSLVEDIRSVAMENHKRELPLIYARAFLRSSAKAAAAFAASQAITDHGRKDGWTNVAVVLGGLAYVAITERADLRCWVLLPGQAHVGLVQMPRGDHLVKIEYLAPGGGLLYATPWRMIRDAEYPPGENGARLRTIVEHFWR